MTAIRSSRRVAMLAGAAALLLQMSPVMAGGQSASDPGNAPVTITFTKWGAPAPAVPPVPFFGLFQGFSGDGLLGSFEAEVLWRQRSVNGHVFGLEALYEVVDGDRSFSALIRGGQNSAGAALLEGVILAGWRTGARVQVEFQRYGAILGVPSCDGAPQNTTCFVGTIHVGQAPTD
jgi:hypothetical protein